MAFIDVGSGLCLVVLLDMSFALLSLFLLQVCMCPITLNHFLWGTVFCINLDSLVLLAKHNVYEVSSQPRFILPLITNCTHNLSQPPCLRHGTAYRGLEWNSYISTDPSSLFKKLHTVQNRPPLLRITMYLCVLYSLVMESSPQNKPTNQKNKTNKTKSACIYFEKQCFK